MARFTSTAPLNILWRGIYEFSGPAGTVHRVDDALYEEFNAEFSGVIPGLTWTDTDEVDSFLTDPITAATANIVTATVTNARFKGGPWHDVRAYGATGDGTTDDTTAVTNAITAAASAGAMIVFPAGTYKVAGPLNIPSGVSLLGAGRYASIIKPSVATTFMLALGVSTRVTIRGLGLDGSAVNVGGISISNTTASAAPVSDILIDDCRIDVSGSTNRDGISMAGYLRRITVRNCHVIGHSAPDDSLEFSSGQSLVIIRNQSLSLGTQQPIWIDSCHIQNGRVGFMTAGTGDTGSPIWFTNNLVEGQIGRGGFFYNPNGIVCTGNVFQNITQTLGPSPGAEQGVVWIDRGGNEPVTFANNHIRDCVGTGLYIENMEGVVSGWNIRDITKRAAGSEYLGQLGGNGILIAGTASFQLTDTLVANCAAAGIRIDRGLGVDLTGRIAAVKIANCVIQACSEDGIAIDNQVRMLTVSDCLIRVNGTSATATYGAIRTVSTSATLSHLSIENCLFNWTDDSGTGNQWWVFRGIHNSLTEYHIINNRLDTGGGEWIKTDGTVRGIIAANLCLNSRGWSLTGSSADYSLIANRNGANGVEFPGSFVELLEVTAPGAGAANTARLYAVDNGSGKTSLRVIFPTGAAQTLATEP